MVGLKVVTTLDMTSLVMVQHVLMHIFASESLTDEDIHFSVFYS